MSRVLQFFHDLTLLPTIVRRAWGCAIEDERGRREDAARLTELAARFHADPEFAAELLSGGPLGLWRPVVARMRTRGLIPPRARSSRGDDRASAAPFSAHCGAEPKVHPALPLERSAP